MRVQRARILSAIPIHPLRFGRFACNVLATLGLAALLAACSTTSDGPVSEARIITPADALIIPPPGGPAIVNVSSTTFPNAVRQDISLATDARTPGENKISVVRFTAKGGNGSDARLRDIPFTHINLTEEALAAWPGTGMAVSPYFVQNAYGPFGYAIGKPANGDTCIYAWQRINPTLKPSGAVDRGTINVRLQLCRRGASEESLLEIMYRLRLNTAVFPPNKAPAIIGSIGNQIRPIGAAGFSEVIPMAKPVAVTRRTQTAPTTTTQTPTPVAIPTPPVGAPIVPSPTGGATGTGGGAGPNIPRPPSGAVTIPSPPATGQ